jgi:saccharopine dehydrogenase (NAD+, L-lysine-forming)
MGIKEINNIDKLNNHTHLYFSHSFKKQKNSNMILDAFSKSNSIIHDFEFFLNNNKRIIAFGEFAGLVGAVLGLKQLYNKIMKLNDINNLSPWNSFDKMLNYIQELKGELDLGNYNNGIKVALVGANGRCGKGVQFILDIFKDKIKYLKIENKNTDLSNFTLKEYDIIFNCILLDEKYDIIWFDRNTIFTKDIIIIDISCDYCKINNPIKLYDCATSWKEPIFKYNNFVDIIAIENLPSLLPFESSNDFSKKCTELLLHYGNDVWKNNLDIFQKVLNNLKN